ncbi:hypothetical protein LTR53_019749, partial [Teratosphaeriaceae sp. CCFEE 6253]
MATLTVQPLQPDELDTFIRIHWAAFEPPDADMVLPMVFPHGLQPDLITELRDRMLRETNGRISEFCSAAKDTVTGKIVAASRWAVKMHPPATQAEVDAEYAQTRQARLDRAPIAGTNTALADVYYRTAMYTEWEDMRGGPY